MNNSSNRKVKFSSVSLKYGEGAFEKLICNDVNLTFKAGEITGILGPNGSGKSTIINSITGLKSLDQGTISYDGFKIIKPRISLIPQDYKSSFFTWANLRNNIRLVSQRPFQKRNNLRNEIESLKSRLGIELDFSLRPQECSGGMLQQAAIIRALSNHEGLILADEPFSALDVEINRKIRKSLRRFVIEEGIVCVMILHDLEDLMSICDRVLVIPGRPFSTISTNPKEMFKILDFENARASDDSPLKSNSISELAKTLFGND